MRGGIRIGSISGIPLYIDSSWFLILGFLAVLLSAAYTKLSPSFSLGYGAITAILFFLSIALNKVAHALMSKARGVEINTINIQFMAAASTDERESKDPFSVFSIAISGPFVSLFLSAIGFLSVWLIAGELIFSSNSKIFKRGNVTFKPARRKSWLVKDDIQILAVAYKLKIITIITNSIKSHSKKT